MIFSEGSTSTKNSLPQPIHCVTKQGSNPASTDITKTSCIMSLYATTWLLKRYWFIRHWIYHKQHHKLFTKYQITGSCMRSHQDLLWNHPGCSIKRSFIHPCLDDKSLLFLVLWPSTMEVNCSGTKTLQSHAQRLSFSSAQDAKNSCKIL